MIRSQHLPLIAAICATGFSLPSPAAAAKAPNAKKGQIDLRVRDSATGYAIPGTVVLDSRSNGSARRSHRLPRQANLRTDVATGAHRLEIFAPRYRALRTEAFVSADESLPITVWLDPLGVVDERRAQTIASALPGSAVVQGFVVDAELGAPVFGAQVLLGGAATQTDERGFFSVRLPIPIALPESLPEQASLRVESAGRETNVLLDMPLVEGETDVLIELRRGSGIRTENGAHKLLRGPEELEQSQSAPADPEAEATGDGPNDGSAVVAPPSSIRVGYNCSCTNCSTVQVMSLETYVKRGLPREWIASWLPHSLRAGAIAYRSYGAYYVAHPLRPGQYDICNTTCCQVNGTTTSPSTNSATDLTAGILLQRSGALFRAEYSAENNNFGCGQPGCSNASCTCGNGSAGSPGASWPCVAEPWDSGRVCSGHGRGMCQWGTQHAAGQGQLWNWIEDHYYNNNGMPFGLRSAYMTSPLDVAWFGPDPATVSAGDFFTIYISAVNYAESAHTEVMLGASLYSGATGYISDATEDAKVTLYAGSNDVARGFNVPPWAPSGSYDLLVALWLDVDGDSAISGADQVLVFYLLPEALTVL